MIRSKKPLVAAIAATLVLTPTLTQLSAGATTAGQPAGRSADLLRKATDVLPLGDGLTAAFDSRASLPVVAPTAAQRSALGALAGASVTWNSSGTPRSIAKTGGALTAPRAGDPLTIARDWLAAQSAVFGLAEADLQALEVVRNHELPGIEARVLSFAQTFGGVASGYGGILTVVVDRDGRVVSYAGDPVRSSSLLGDFDLSPAQAVARTVTDLLPGLDLAPRATGKTQGGYDVFTAGPLADVLRVRKIAFPTPTGARAAYAV
ncbi:MAG: hypothetical protein Q8O61_16220, partial [Nocardioides sp.]|nr:hypothetical protein [Nocardioides sp.]